MIDSSLLIFSLLTLLNSLILGRLIFFFFLVGEGGGECFFWEISTVTRVLFLPFQSECLLFFFAVLQQQVFPAICQTTVMKIDHSSLVFNNGGKTSSPSSSKMSAQRHHFANKGPSSQSYGFPAVMYGCESWTIKKVEQQQ